MGNGYAKYSGLGGGGSGSGSGVTIYPNFGSFPASAPTGTLAIDASTGTLYEYFGGSWQILAVLGGTGGGTIEQQDLSGQVGAGNVNFVLAFTPQNLQSLAIFIDGTIQLQSTYSLAANVVTFLSAPLPAQKVVAFYLVAGSGGGGGTVTSVSVASANGFGGSVATSTTTPVITLNTSITGLLKGNGTAISAAVAGTDYQTPLTFGSSLVNTAGSVTLVNDSASPGNNYYYGTNGLGVKGYYSLSTGGVTSVTATAPIASSGGTTPVISLNSNGVTNAYLAQIPANSYLGNNTAAAANAAYITNTQLTANLNLFTNILQGLVPASGGGVTNFLRADGTFAAPVGTTYIFGTSLVNTAGTVTLVNDVLAPGNNYYYGTGPTGTKGFFTIPATGVTSVTGTAPIVSSGGSTPAISLAANGVANSYLAQIPANSYLGNNTGAAANAAYITSTQLTANLNVFTSALQGLVPASGGTSTSLFLNQAGTFTSPASSSVYQVVPTGTINGVNTSFTVAVAPTATQTFILYLDGLALTQGVDYTIAGSTITMTVAPKIGSSLLSFYLSTTLTSTYITSVANSANINLSVAAGVLTATLSGGIGTVTSFAFTNANGFTGTVTNSTTTPTLSLGTSVTGILYGNGSSVAAAVAANFPTLNQNTTGTAANVTGTVAIANGGTGQITQQLAINALAGGVTSGQYLRGNGTNILLSTIQAADVPTLNQNTTGTAANITATSNATLTTLSVLALPASQLTGFTSGSIPYSNGTGLTQNNSALYWNNASLFLGIGTNSPDSPLTVNTSGTLLPVAAGGVLPSLHAGSVTGNGTLILLDAWANTPQIVFRRADTSAAAPSAIQSGDILMNIVGSGYGATSYQAAGAGKIVLTAAENFTDATGSAYLSLYTRPTGTAGASTERVRVTGAGLVGINTTTPKSQLDVSGNMSLGTYAGVTAAPANSLIVSGSIGIGVTAPAQALDVGATGQARIGALIGSSAQPTVAYGTGAGTGPATVAIAGAQTSGYIQFTTGTGPVAGNILTLTFPNAASTYAFCQFFAANAAAAPVPIYCSTFTATTAVLATTSALAASTAYAFTWLQINY